MKQVKRMKLILALALVFAMVSPTVLPIGNVAVAEAKSKAIKLNVTKATITVGKSTTLSVKGTTKKAKWSSSDKKVATVTKNGKVTGVAAGTATITATVDGKKYNCKVTVKEKVVTNPYTEKTAYESKAVSVENINYVIPQSWVYETNKNAPGYVVNYLKGADTSKACSNVLIAVMNNTGKLDNTTLKVYLDDLVKGQVAELKTKGYTDVTYKISDYTYDNGTAIMLDLTYTYQGVKYTVKAYDILVGNYWIELNSTDINDGATPAVSTIVTDMLNSLQVVK
jgi:hypothetical protein